MVKVLGFMLALSVVIGCGSTKDTGDDDNGDDDDTPVDPTVDDTKPVAMDLTVAFSPMYSAFIDDEHPCKIPAIVTGVTGGIIWSATDLSKVKLEPDGSGTGGVLITTRAPGEVDIIARAGSLSGKAHLTISSFTADDWEAGNKRYNSDIKYTAPTMADIMKAFMDAQAMADGGMPNFGGLAMKFLPPDDAACTNCHGEGASMLSVQHTSQQIGGFSDEDLVKVITMGIKPPNSLMLTNVPMNIYQIFHTWDAATAEQNGILAYLRALPPKTQGPIDFQGAGMMVMGTGTQ